MAQIQDGVVRVCGLARHYWVRGASRLTGSSPARIPPQQRRGCGPERYSASTGTSQRCSPAYQDPPTPRPSVFAASPGLDPRACAAANCRPLTVEDREIFGAITVNITATGHVCRAPSEPVLHSLQPTKTTLRSPFKIASQRFNRRGSRSTSYGIRVHFCWRWLYYEANYNRECALITKQEYLVAVITTIIDY